MSEYNELPPKEQNEEQENENTTIRRSNRAIKIPEWLNNFDVANTGVDDTDTIDQMTLYEVVGVGMGNVYDNTQELYTITYNKAMKSEDKLKWKEAVEEEYKKMENTKCSSQFQSMKLTKCNCIIIQMGNEEKGS